VTGGAWRGGDFQRRLGQMVDSAADHWTVRARHGILAAEMLARIEATYGEESGWLGFTVGTMTAEVFGIVRRR
jgi:hypothetical protein